MAQPRGPLAGVKVVACSTAQAGTVPYVLMADLGAEVIKIEPPGVGDHARGSGLMPGFPSTYFETNNRGVKSLTLNLKTPEGRKILYELVTGADVFGQNFRPGAAEKNGFGYEQLRQVNPKIVYVSVSGYGPHGPHATLPGTDSMAQALGGIAEAFSTPGQPLKTGIVSVADETCAILAFGGILAGLYCAKTTGVPRPGQSPGRAAAPALPSYPTRNGCRVSHLGSRPSPGRFGACTKPSRNSSSWRQIFPCIGSTVSR